jgi:predicted nucleic acid-binding protein
MKLFLDANVLVSILNREMPVFTYSSRVVSLPTFQPRFSLYTSPICLAIAYYFAEKKCGNSRALEKMKLLSNELFITNVGKEEVLQVNTNKKIVDYEDGLKCYSALKAGCTHIISENKKDFYFSEIPVFSSKEFILNEL